MGETNKPAEKAPSATEQAKKAIRTSKSKKAQDESIMKNLPQNVEWIKQPYALSVMRGDLSLTQTHIMVELMGALQVKINDFISHMGEEGNAVFKEEDFDEEGVAHVDVPLAAVSNRPDYYNEVERMALRLMSTTIKKPETVEGQKMIRYSHVFHDIYVPSEDTERNRRLGFIRFTFDRTQAKDIFDFTRYSKYIKAVARNSSSQYTSRLYMIITAYKGFGTWKVDYSELRKILGFYVYEQGESGKFEWVEKKYTEYRQFKRRVLATAETELRELAQKGEADCYFEFSEIYPEGKKNGTPEKILFTITTSDMGESENRSSQMARKIIDIEDFLKQEFGFRTTDIRQILPHINQDNVDTFIAKINDVKAYIIKNEGKIKDKKKYAITAINNMFMDYQEAIAEEIKDDEKFVAQESQNTDFGGQNKQNNGSVNDEIWRGKTFSDQPFREKLIAEFGNKTYTMYLMQMRIISYTNNVLGIYIQHEEISDYIDSNNLINRLKTVLSAIVGPIQNINYLMGTAR